jgi:hypothetical protein
VSNVCLIPGVDQSAHADVASEPRTRHGRDEQLTGFVRGDAGSPSALHRRKCILPQRKSGCGECWYTDLAKSVFLAACMFNPFNICHIISRFGAGGSQETFKWFFQRLILVPVSILVDGLEQISLTVVSCYRLLLDAYMCFIVAGPPRKSMLVSG